VTKRVPPLRDDARIGTVARLASVHPCSGRALEGPCAPGCRLGTASANKVRTIGADALRQGSDARASLLVSEASLPGLASRSLHL
jgi:hypothetical protein